MHFRRTTEISLFPKITKLHIHNCVKAAQNKISSWNVQDYPIRSQHHKTVRYVWLSFSVFRDLSHSWKYKSCVRFKTTKPRKKHTQNAWANRPLGKQTQIWDSPFMRKTNATVIYPRTIRSADQKRIRSKHIKLDQNITKSNERKFKRNA